MRVPCLPKMAEGPPRLLGTAPRFLHPEPTAERRARLRVPWSPDTEDRSARFVDLLALDELIEQLRVADERAADVFDMHYFGAMTHAEIAAYLGVSERTVRNDWQTARAWLGSRLRKESS